MSRGSELPDPNVFSTQLCMFCLRLKAKIAVGTQQNPLSRCKKTGLNPSMRGTCMTLYSHAVPRCTHHLNSAGLTGCGTPTKIFLTSQES